MGKNSSKGGRPIIVRREEIVEGGHHGGAWKVAYADFVTAMMAFFLLMWLLNATTEEQRRGLADYFAPQGQMAHSTSGTGAPFGGRTPYEKGSLVSDRGSLSVVAGKSSAQPDTEDEESELSPQPLPPRTRERQADAGGADDAREAPGHAAAGPQGAPAAKVAATVSFKPSPETEAAAAREERARLEAEKRELTAFEQAAQQIRDAVRADPALADLARQLAIDQTPEGLRIQLLDEEKRAMFATGSAVLNERARLLLQKIAPILARLSEGVSIAGHTDAAPYKGGDRSNWELSSERANATRRLLVESGVQEGRLRSITGNADRDLLLPADPLAAANRRIAIVVLRSVRSLPTTPPPAALAPAPGRPPP